MKKIFHMLSEIRSQYLLLNTNWIISLCTKFVLLFFVIGMIAIIWQWSSLPPQVPLWYAKPWGVERLAYPGWLFLLPLGSLVWYGMDLFVAIYVTREYLVFTQLLFITSLIASSLSCITLLKILFLVT